MRRLTQLYLELDRTTRTSDKVAALRSYFREAPREDSVWTVHVLSGRPIGRSVSSTRLSQWASEVSGIAPWLLGECYHVVGDFSETLSLILPENQDHQEPPALHEVIEERLRRLGKMRDAEQRETIVRTWSQLNTDQRLVFHKLLTRDFRVGVSRPLLIRALAEVAGVEPAVMAHRIAGSWVPNAATMRRFLSGAGASDVIDPALPYPFMLAHPLHDRLATLGAIHEWFCEWKWDGIRAQLIRRQGQVIFWSRGDELVSSAFPELVQAGATLPEGTVLDGEIVAWDDSAQRPYPFAKLQRRINRKNVELSFWPDVPVAYIAFDILEHEGKDLRGLPLRDRRDLLSQVLSNAQSALIRISPRADCSSWEHAEKLIAESRERGVEGLMLKRFDSTYQPGRVTGLWWKLKIQPFTVDAVLIAAQPGHGKRAGLLTDYTFGVWDNGELVPVAKAYSGLTDEEIALVDRFVRHHTIERFGPVRSVEPTMVFELGFEAIQRSDRHKSGIAVRFPRMLRMRTDKKAAEADTLQTLRELLAECEKRG